MQNWDRRKSQIEANRNDKLIIYLLMSSLTCIYCMPNGFVSIPSFAVQGVQIDDSAQQLIYCDFVFSASIGIQQFSNYDRDGNKPFSYV